MVVIQCLSSEICHCVIYGSLPTYRRNLLSSPSMLISKKICHLMEVSLSRELLLFTYLLTDLLTAIEVSPGGSSRYSSTNKTNKIYIKETIQKHSTTIHNTVNTSTHITKTPTHYKTHSHSHIRNKFKKTTVQDTHQMK